METAEALASFLRQRLDEDHVVAFLAELEEHRMGEANFIVHDVGSARQRYASRFCVSRMRTDIAARQQLVALHGQPEHLCPGVRGVREPCVTLRLLALPYFDHRDFEQHWRP